MARMAGGKLFQMTPFRAPVFNGNFSTPFNKDSTSSNYEFFNGNTQFGQISPMQVQTEANPGVDKKISPERVGKVQAKVRKNKLPPAM